MMISRSLFHVVKSGIVLGLTSNHTLLPAVTSGGCPWIEYRKGALREGGPWLLQATNKSEKDVASHLMIVWVLAMC